MKMTKKEFVKFASPSMSVMLLLMIVPLLLTVMLSFCTYTYGSAIKFVGLRNYINVLSNDRFWSASVFTICVCLVVIPLTLLLGLYLAMVLYHNKSKLVKAVFISTSLIPFAIAPVVSTLLFSWQFKDTWGIVTVMLSEMGIHIEWFANVWASRALVVMHYLWANTAFILLVLYAALQAMPLEPLKAAEVEGSNMWHKLRYVFLPYLKPLIVFTTTINIMDAYRLYDSVAVMTKGGPGTSTETVSLFNFRTAFNQLSLGQAGAISVLLVITIFILMSPCLYLMYKETKESDKK